MDTLAPAADLAARREPLFAGESPAYAAARRDLLAAEIEARRVLSRLADQRRALPPGPVIEDYRFRDADGRDRSLLDLFGDHDTLVSYFWMYGPERDAPCPMCTNTLAGLDPVIPDVEQRAAFVVMGRSPVARQRAFAETRGWRHLTFVQTLGDDYARDHGGLKDDGEYPIFAVFRRDGDRVRLFYAAEMPLSAADPGQDPRSATDLSPLWNVLDHTPEGRGTDWYPKLAYPEDAR